MIDDAAAIAWLQDALNVPRETIAQLDVLRSLVIAENAHQNLISASSIASFWTRHIVDSAQLLPLAASARAGAWLDLGTGAGFPGLVVALLSDRPMILVESRRKRFEFLLAVTQHLKLDHVSVHGGTLQSLATRIVSVISARAFAPLPKLLTLAHRFSRNETIWLLPKGKSVGDEMELISGTWQSRFHVEPSITDPFSEIIVGTSVNPVRTSHK